MSLVGPPPASANPFDVIRNDLRLERAATAPFPPGPTSFSMARTNAMVNDPVPMLVEAYQRYGPAFTMRVFHHNVVFMIGPAANHHILVSNASNFLWREGHFRDLIPFMGDGLLTIDGDFHRRSRQIMLPAFHHKQIAKSIDIILEETERALSLWHIDAGMDLYDWTRRLALRVAMRAIFGLDPDGEEARRIDAAHLFTEALDFFSKPALQRLLRGPLTPYHRTLEARKGLDRLVYAEMARRRSTGERGLDVLSLLLDAQDEDGNSLSDRHVRDEVMTLLFAGHDTTTSTVAFMFYELAHNPELMAPVVAEQDRVLGDRPLAAADLTGTALPELEMLLEETLRKYPPAWIGPRRSVADFEFAGMRLPGGVPVNYSSWVSHHLPDVFDHPDEFRPSRFAPEAKAALPKGAYVPFGGGSRTCIGMRFGQLEIRTIASLILRRYTLALRDPDYRLRIRQMPTIGPARGLPIIVRPRYGAGSPPLAAAA
jgi:cytochrome P450